MTEDELVGHHHRLSGREFVQTPGDSEEQGAYHAPVHAVAKNRTQLTNTVLLILARGSQEGFGRSVASVVRRARHPGVQPEERHPQGAGEGSHQH